MAGCNPPRSAAFVPSARLLRGAPSGKRPGKRSFGSSRRGRSCLSWVAIRIVPRYVATLSSGRSDSTWVTNMPRCQSKLAQTGAQISPDTSPTNVHDGTDVNRELMRTTTVHQLHHARARKPPFRALHRWSVHRLRDRRGCPCGVSFFSVPGFENIANNRQKAKGNTAKKHGPNFEVNPCALDARLQQIWCFARQVSRVREASRCNQKRKPRPEASGFPVATGRSQRRARQTRPVTLVQTCKFTAR